MMLETDTREQLDVLRCGDPRCDHAHGNKLWLVAPCHPRAGLDVSYNQDCGCLSLECHRCKAYVGRIAVAA